MTTLDSSLTAIIQDNPCTPVPETLHSRYLVAIRMMEFVVVTTRNAAVKLSTTNKQTP